MSGKHPLSRRSYRSRHRAEAAARTHAAIIRAAVELHGRGITTLAAVAEAAGVSLPTVSKHFPTREDLFAACTRHAAESMVPPNAVEIALLADPLERTARGVRETYAMHEMTLGLCWTGYRLAAESRAMDEAMQNYEALVASLADAILHGTTVDDTTRGFVRAILGPLAYRALRLDAGLDADQAVASTTRALRRLLTQQP